MSKWQPTQADAVFVAGRLRGLGIIKQEVGGYSQLTHEAILRVLQETVSASNASSMSERRKTNE